LWDELAQLRQVAGAVKDFLHCAQEEEEKATQALKQVQGVLIEHRRIAEKEKISLQTKFDEEKHKCNKKRNNYSQDNLR